jgi:hypothetical protein
MSEDTQPILYTVTNSERTREKLLELAVQAHKRGDGPAFANAVREFDRRLRIYPQFGDPLFDLKVHEGQIRLGIVLPLSIRYGVLEKLRAVWVSALPILLPMKVNKST